MLAEVAILPGEWLTFGSTNRRHFFPTREERSLCGSVAQGKTHQIKDRGRRSAYQRRGVWHG